MRKRIASVIFLLLMLAGLMAPAAEADLFTQQIVVRNDADSCFAAAWQPVPGATGYEIRYSTEPHFFYSTIVKTIEGGNVCEFRSGKLTRNETYYVQVRSVRRLGDVCFFGEWSETATVTIRCRILMIGNSLTYYYDIPGLLAEKTGAEVASTVRSGATLADHLDEEDELYPELLQYFEKERWDYVIFQDRSNRAFADHEAFLRDVSAICEMARENGAEPVLYMTWPYRKASKLMNSKKYSYERMYQLLYESYHDAADQNGIACADAGRAFYEAGVNGPFYMEDGKHPNPQGAELAAQILAETISGGCLSAAE